VYYQHVIPKCAVCGNDVQSVSNPLEISFSVRGLFTVHVVSSVFGGSLLPGILNGIRNIQWETCALRSESHHSIALTPKVLFGLPWLAKSAVVLGTGFCSGLFLHHCYFQISTAPRCFLERGTKRLETFLGVSDDRDSTSYRRHLFFPVLQ
jgi:hypothetical protein